MGLDITAYGKITPLDCVFDSDGEPIDPKTREPLDGLEYFQANVNQDFPDRSKDIADNGVYTYETSTGFRAGSYGGYNNWRESLAKLAGYAPEEEDRYGSKRMRHDAGAWSKTSGPFWELILFSACEGTIGPKVSAKLAKDFADYQTKADAHEDEYFRSKYAEWREAFEMAANNGAVDFH